MQAINENGGKYAGMSRYDAKTNCSRPEKEGYLVKITDHTIMLESMIGVIQL